MSQAELTRDDQRDAWEDGMVRGGMLVMTRQEYSDRREQLQTEAYADGRADEREEWKPVLEALRELTVLEGIRCKYSAARPDSPRHPLWEQYLLDVADFQGRLERAWDAADAAIEKAGG
jgi:hypothetical protein